MPLHRAIRATVAAIAALTTGCASSSRQPQLGLPLVPNSVGFGKVRPSRVFNGGDPTGDFTGITWQTWGGQQAHGTGTGYWEPPGEPVAASIEAPINLVAYDLGDCRGRPAYRHLAVYFPTHGQHFDPVSNAETQYDLCHER